MIGQNLILKIIIIPTLTTPDPLSIALIPITIFCVTCAQELEEAERIAFRAGTQVYTDRYELID